MSTIFTYNNQTVSPAPKINIQSEISYANDNIIGYTYSVSLNGIAIADQDKISFLGTISKIDDIKRIFTGNGSRLIVSNNGETVIEGIGGILISLDFDSDNSFSRYSTYTATISFNELKILQDSFSCTSSQIPSDSFSSNLWI